ncbi:MAG: Lrp/AsnC family transcriptional regulator [Desulfobacterales bacterium]|nr:Lrp/AsnC family transcriptional regulator [Desulfobacterales bacterium]
MVLDRIDKKILNTLQENGRITNSKLSQIVGISAPATLERVKRLEQAGVISHFTAVVDPEKIGITITALVSIGLSLDNLTSVEDIKEKFAALEEVVECYQIAGANDFILKVVARNIKSYGEFMNQKLALIPGIQGIKSSFIIDNVKEKKMYQLSLEEEYKV